MNTFIRIRLFSPSSSSSSVIRTATIDQVKYIIGMVKFRLRKLSERC